MINESQNDLTLIKKAEHQRIDTFKLWCWRRLLRVPWTVNAKGNQPWIFIGKTMLKLKLQYFGHLMRRADSLEKTLMLGKIEGRRRRNGRGRDGWMASSTEWTWVWASSRRWWGTGKHVVLQSMGLQRVRLNWVTEKQWECKTSITEYWYNSPEDLKST